MKKHEKQTVQRDVVISIICNKCEKEIKNTEEFNPEFNACQNFKIEFGYGSELDGLKMDFDLCKDCTFDFIKSLNITPTAFPYLLL